jgi:hypothetical protein
MMYLRRLLGRRGHRSRGSSNRSGLGGCRNFLRRRLLGSRAEMLAHLLRNVLLDGAGVRPLISDPQFRKIIQDRFALDL